MLNNFLGLEFEKSLRNRKKYGLHTELDLFLPIADESFITTRVFRMIKGTLVSSGF